MKTIDEYMQIHYKMEVIEDTSEPGFIVSFPDLPGCVTCASTAENIIEIANDARRVWFEAAIENNYSIPEPSSENSYSGQFKFRMPKSLHKQLSEHAKHEGISMNQYCLYLLTKYDTMYAREHSV